MNKKTQIAVFAAVTMFAYFTSSVIVDIVQFATCSFTSNCMNFSSTPIDKVLWVIIMAIIVALRFTVFKKRFTQ